jgi:O-antigen/teichoic acid export membrane protein
MKSRKGLFGSAIVYTIANILSAGIPFLLLPVLTRVLTPAEYGLVTIFTITVGIFGVLTGCSVHGAVGIRYFQLAPVALAQYVGACHWILAGSTLIVSLLLIAGGEWFSNVTGLTLAWLLAGVVMSGAQFIANIGLSLWQVRAEAIRYAAFQVLQSLANAGLSLFFVLALSMGWQGRAVGQVAATMLFAITAVLLLKRRNLIAMPKTPAKDIRDALHFGVPLIPHALGGLLIATGDRWIIGKTFGTAEVGIYTVAVQVATGLTMVCEAVFRAVHPWLIEHAGKDADRRQLVMFIYKLLGIAAVGCAMYYVLAWFAYPYIVSSQFQGGKVLLGVLALATFFRCCYHGTSIFISVANRNSLLARNTLFAGTTGLICTYLLVQHLGILGAAIGLMVGELISFLLSWRSSARVFPMPWFSFR